MEAVLSKMREAMQDGDARQMQCLTQKAISMGIHPHVIIRQILEPTMRQIGEKFRKDEVFIPDVLLSARAMHASLHVLKPLVSKTVNAVKGKIVIGTVAGDLHDIGKNIVGIMLEGGGYDVVDIGIDVPVTEFVSAVRKHNPDILGISAALTTTIEKIFDVVSELKRQNLRNDLLIIVGGTPVSLAFAKQIGADGYCSNGCQIVDLADNLCRISRNKFRHRYGK